LRPHRSHATFAASPSPEPRSAADTSDGTTHLKGNRRTPSDGDTFFGFGFCLRLHLMRSTPTPGITRRASNLEATQVHDESRAIRGRVHAVVR